MIKNLPAMQETQVWSVGWKDPLEKDMATHSSVLARRIPRAEEPWGLQFMGSHRVGHHCTANTTPTRCSTNTKWDKLRERPKLNCQRLKIKRIFKKEKLLITWKRSSIILAFVNISNINISSEIMEARRHTQSERHTRSAKYIYR